MSSSLKNIPFDFLESKNVAIFVCGSISIYKSCELIRLFTTNNINVKVVMSKGARKFICPIVFESLSKHTVLYEENESWANDNNHIDIGKWADLFIIAPATANSINKISSGIADDLFTSSILAFNKTIILAPSANGNMLENPITANNIEKLKKLSFIIIEPLEKELICGDYVTGALANIEDIFLTSLRHLHSKEYFKNREIIITGGSSIEKIDDIRYISNFSSGKMAYYLALISYIYGANVSLISSSLIHYNTLLNYKYWSSSKELLGILANKEYSKTRDKKGFLFSVSAICDYLPKYTKGKNKKKDIGDIWDLKLNKNIDILSTSKFYGYKVGFKAETNKKEAVTNSKIMLKNKKLDAVCLNIVSDEVFNKEENQITIFTKDEKIELDKEHKLLLSKQILDKFIKIFK